MPQHNRYTYDNLSAAVANSTSWKQVLQGFGVAPGGGTQLHLRNLAQEWGINVSHFRIPQHSGKNRKRFFSEVLVLLPPGKVENTKILRRALIESGRKYQCEECGLGPEWNGKPLVIQIDHRNGKRNDNRPENLFFVDPNCHTQTDNYGSKNATTLGKREWRCVECEILISRGAKRCIRCARKSPSRFSSISKIVWPELEILIEMVNSLGYKGAGKSLGVSDNSVRTHLRRRSPEFSLASSLVMITCDWCGVQFERKPWIVQSRQKRGTIGSYCSNQHAGFKKAANRRAAS